MSNTQKKDSFRMRKLICISEIQKFISKCLYNSNAEALEYDGFIAKHQWILGKGAKH